MGVWKGWKGWKGGCKSEGTSCSVREDGEEAVLGVAHPSVIQRGSKLHARVSCIITVAKNLPFCAAEREWSFELCTFYTHVFI